MFVSHRSYLYVPGDRPDRFERARQSGADAVILDLEDAVPVQNKSAALQNVLAALDGWKSKNGEPWVRINRDDQGLRELSQLAEQGRLAGVFVPKSSLVTLAAIGDVVQRFPSVDGPPVRVCALVESAVGIQQLSDLARLSHVGSIGLGEVDLMADLGITPEKGDANLWPLRLSAVVACAAAGIDGPIGPVWRHIRDVDGLRSSVQALRQSGFGAVQAVHPEQIPVINEAFTPTDAEYDRASRLIESAQGGAFLDESGRMVDEAVLRSARRTVEEFQNHPASSR
jgi:citrate lyase subunit beta/citryl-CoA lyase